MERIQPVDAHDGMSSRTAKRLAVALVGASFAMVGAGLALGAISAQAGIALGFTAVTVSYGISGGILAMRRPSNPIGWLMAGVGFAESTLVFGAGYAAFVTNHWQAGPFAEIAAWTGNWIWTPGLGVVCTFLLLLFPDGHPPTPRWRWVAWVAGIGLVVGTIGSAIGLWGVRWEILADPQNNELSPSGVAGAIGGMGLFLLFGVAGVASIVSVFVRWRRAVGDERQQLRWFFLAAAVIAAGFIATEFKGSSFLLLFIGVLLLPVTIVIAVLKYRLYDLDIVIKKTVVFLLIAAGLTILSLAVLLVVPLFAVGTMTGWERGLFVVGVVIGTTFGPLRRLARRVADRLVYGRRATPYEVLAEFSGRLGTTYADEDVTSRMAQLLREATGADAAHVWLAVSVGSRPVASAPVDADAATWPADGVEVQYRGEHLGGLSVDMPANDPLDPRRKKLIDDLAGQAGPVLANVRLIEELRASRRRIVSAQDVRAKKLERDIHDGAQQQLVALTVKLRLLEQIADRDPTRAKEMASTLQADATGALEDLRDLARGIYPPLLADKGLGAALEAQARKAVVPTAVAADGVGRFPQEVESAVYFSCLEALQNVAKYADATKATISLSNGDGLLRFSVSDDGRGFDPASTGYGTGLQGIADRLAAIGGELALASEPGGGATISGRVPISSQESAT